MRNRLAPLLRLAISLLLGRIVLPAWLAIAVAIFLTVPAVNDAVHFWLDTAETTPGWAAKLAPIIASSYFPGALGLFGLCYLILVGYEGTDIIRHTIVPVVGWIVVGLCLIAVLVTTGIGYFELRVRQEADKVALGIPRGASPAENNAARPQRPLQTQSRILQPDQIRILLQELPKFQQYQSKVFLASTPSDFETGSVIGQYPPLLVRSGIEPSMGSIKPRGPEDQGLIIAVAENSPIPEAAKRFQQILEVADIHVRIVAGNWVNVGPGYFIFWAAPAPLY